MNTSVLITVALKSTLVLAATWLIALALRRRSAAARHVIWTACAAALLALPLLSIALPALRLSIATALLPANTFAFETSATATAATTAPARPSPANTHSAPTSNAPAPPISWRSLCLILWPAGIALSVLQMLVAYIALWRIRRAARLSPFVDLAQSLARELGITTPIRVLESRHGMPMTFGVLRPTVLLPACAAEWSDDRRRIVLLHELAHIRRGDAATHLLARTAFALNWPNPLAWIAWRAFLRERERAADDLVLTAGAPPADYAAHLLEIARSFQPQPAIAAAGLAMARRSQLEGRLLSILDSHAPRTQPRRAIALLAVVAALAVIVPLAAIRAQSDAERAPLADVDATILAANAQKNRALLDQVAVSYEQLRKYDQARKLREAALALAEETAGNQSAEYATALVNLGELAERSGNRQQARDYFLRAIALGDRPESFPALMNLARSAKDPEKRREYLERARVAGRDGDQIGAAMTWLARDRQSDPQGIAYADSLYRSAIAIETEGSTDQALTMELYAGFLFANDRAEEGSAMQDRARVLRRALAAAIGSRLATDSAPFVVGKDTSGPRLLKKIEPEYTDAARALKIQGPVILKVVIDTDGIAKNLEVVSGVGYGLDEKAAAAISLWKFQPGMRGGTPVPVKATIEVNFRLL